MKKLSTYLFLFLFSFSVPSFADDIFEYKIEGISLGDSLLDYLSKEEIITEIESNKYMYENYTDEFGSVSLYRGFKNYYSLSFKVRTKDENYYIHSISGHLLFDNKLDSCLAEQKKIEKEFSSNYTNITKRKQTYLYPFDPTGESVTYNIIFDFDTGGQFEINCAVFKKSLKNKYNWEDGLVTSIHTKEVVKWFVNMKINKKVLD